MEGTVQKMRECPWVMASDKWNDENFNVKSIVYENLYSDFRESIDLSFECVKSIGTLTQ